MSGPRAATETTGLLAEVTMAASASRQARARFEEAVVAASDAGHSLRRIAEAAGVSHEHVRTIVGARASGSR